MQNEKLNYDFSSFREKLRNKILLRLILYSNF